MKLNLPARIGTVFAPIGAVIVVSIFAVLLMGASISAAPAQTAQPEVPLYGLTADQVANLEIVNVVVQNQDDRQRVMGMMLQETLAGKLSLVGHVSQDVGLRAYGLMHVKLVALDDVLTAHPKLWPGKHIEEVKIVRLMTDHEFNVTVAYLYFELQKKKGLSPDDALLAYNMGYDAYIKARDALKHRKSKNYSQRVSDHAASAAVVGLTS